MICYHNLLSQIRKVFFLIKDLPYLEISSDSFHLLDLVCRKVYPSTLWKVSLALVFKTFLICYDPARFFLRSNSMLILQPNQITHGFVRRQYYVFTISPFVVWTKTCFLRKHRFKPCIINKTIFNHHTKIKTKSYND